MSLPKNINLNQLMVKTNNANYMRILSNEEIFNLNTYNIKGKLNNGNNDIGLLIGLIDKNSFRVGVYLGDSSVLVIFERGRGIIRDAFKLLRKTLKRNKSLSEINKSERVYFYELNKACIIYVYKPNIIDYIKIVPFDYLKLLERNLTVLDSLKKGDLIALKRKVYYHTAIVVDNSTFEVIHLYRELDFDTKNRNAEVLTSFVSGEPIKKSKVLKQHILDVLKTSELYKMNEYYDAKMEPKTTDEILQYAYSHLGKEGYNLTKGNCQHFATKCRYGRAQSYDVEKYKHMLKTFSYKPLMKTSYEWVKVFAKKSINPDAV